MNKKDIFIYIIVFCWFVLMPTVFYLLAKNQYFPAEGIQSEMINNIFRIFSTIFIFTIFFLWLKSLIKLIFYNKIKENKFLYKNKLIQYSIFLLIVFFAVYLNSWRGNPSSIELGGDHDLFPPINNY